MSRHLLGLQGWKKSQIEEILHRALRFSSNRNRKLSNLNNCHLAALFFEPSTRTRFSFEIAARWLSAEFYNFPVETSSVLKGESLLDTVNTLQSMGINAMIIRHWTSGMPEWLSTRTRGLSLINAGDGTHEHPTQALLDLYTIKKYHSTLEGLRVVMVGDIKHSRVVRSMVAGLKTLGASVVLVGPPTLLPEELSGAGVELSWKVEPYIKEADIVYMLRLQKERQQKGLIPSLKEYTLLYGLNRERVSRLKPGAIVMHPGPWNIGVEITSGAISQIELRKDVKLSIKEQVENGIVVRASVLDYLLGEKANE